MWAYPEIRSLGDLPAYYARHEPRRLALSEAGRQLDFAAFNEAACRVAQALTEAGVARGDRVMFLGKNSIDFFAAMFGTAKAGGCFVPLNWRLAAAELAEVIADCGGVLAIVERDCAGLWESAGAGSAATVWSIDGNDRLVDRLAERPATEPGIAVGDDDDAIQLYTSGTTGRPKGVRLSHGGFNRMRLCEHFEPAYDWEDGDSFLLALPNFHLLGIGISLQCLYNGVALTIERQFDPAAVLAAITRDRPTLLVLTPTMIQMLLDHPAAEATDFSSLRLTMYAGSPISLGLIKRAIAKMPCRFMQFYGATESNGALSLLRPDEHDLTDERKLQSCGRPLPLIEFKIVDAEGRPVADGDPGELLVRAPPIMAGYWRQPEATAAAMVDGWYRTGDVARRDTDGLYYLVDRVKDMIVTGGENVYSAEVENVVSTHPSVAAVAVIGVPDARWGEAVTAVIVPRPGQVVDAAELVGFCRGRLAAYKVPKRVEISEALPMTPSGKVSKKDLRAIYWAGEQRSVA